MGSTTTLAHKAINTCKRKTTN